MKVVERTWSDFWAYYWRVTERNKVPNIAEYDRKVVGLIQAVCALPPHARILDLGCGNGDHARLLAGEGHSVTAIDVAGSQVEYARAHVNVACASATFIQGDMRCISYDQEFDLCTLLSGTFGFFSQEENQALLAKIHRSLVSGGRLFIMYISSHRTDLHCTSWKEIDGGYQLTKSWFEPESSTYHSSIRLIMDSGEVVVPKEEPGYHATECIRCYTPTELSQMLQQAGFSNIAHLSRRQLDDPSAPPQPLEIKDIVVAVKDASAGSDSRVTSR